MRVLYNREEQDKLVSFLKSTEYQAEGVEFRFYVGPRDFSDVLETGDYKVGGDSPAWSLSTNLPLRLGKRLRGAPVRLFADLSNMSMMVFYGKLSLPVPSPDTYSTDLLAATPGALLDKVKLEEDVEYPGRTPRAVLQDAFQRVGSYDRSRIFIPRFEKPILDFTQAAQTGFKSSDSAKTVIDAVNNALTISYYDTSYDAGVDVSTALGTGEGIEIDWKYQIEGHEVFSFPEPKFATPDEQYSRVVVEARNDDGSIRLSVDAEVDNSDLEYPPLENQTMYIPWEGVDGSDEDARQLATDTARSLKFGSWTVDPIVAYNPLLKPGRPVTFAGEHEDDEGMWWRVWRCLVTGIGSPFGSGVASQLATRAVLVQNDRMPDPPIILGGISPGVVLTPRVLFEFDVRGLYKNANITKGITSTETGHYYDIEESFGLIERNPNGTFIDAKAPDGGMVAIRESEVLPFGYNGQITPGAGRSVCVTRYPGRVFSAMFSLTDPANQDIIIDINKNGASVFTNQALRPRIPAGQIGPVDIDLEEIGVAFNVVRGDRLTMDLDQVGTGIDSGYNFTGDLECSRTA